MTGEKILSPEDRALDLGRLVPQLILFREEIEAKVPDYFRFNQLRVLSPSDTELSPATEHHASRRGDYLSAIENVLGMRVVFAESLDRLNPIDRLFHLQAVAPNSHKAAPHTHTPARDVTPGLHSTTAVSHAPADEEAAASVDEEAFVRALLRRHEETRRREAARVEEAVGSLRWASMETQDGQTLHFCTGGRGERTVVLVNAYGQSLGYWPRLLAKLLERHRVIVWFARGSERRTVGLERFSPRGVHAEDLHALLTRERVEQCDLLGWCTGPKLMLEYYARHPERVATMTFITGAFKNFKNRRDLETAYEKDLEPLFGMVKRMPHLAGPLKDTLKGALLAQKADASSARLGDADSHRRALEMLSTVSESLQPLVVEPFATEHSVRNYAEQVLDFWEHDISSLLPGVRVPVLSIGGECDKVASPQMSRAVAELIPRAKHFEVIGGSHYLHYEKHELVAEMLNGFLRETWDFDFRHNLIKRY